jgi:hypothetical protein
MTVDKPVTEGWNEMVQKTLADAGLTPSELRLFRSIYLTGWVDATNAATKANDLDVFAVRVVADIASQSVEHLLNAAK